MMARYKVVDRNPRFLPIVLEAQLMAGSFEYALDYLIEHEIDLSGIAKRYVNDETGAPAYDPAVFTQVLLICDRQGLIGRQMFAIDGVKLPSNADKRHSGTHAELAHEAKRMEGALASKIAEPGTFDAGARALYRTAETDGVFCYTFFKGVGVKDGGS